MPLDINSLDGTTRERRILDVELQDPLPMVYVPGD